MQFVHKSEIEICQNKLKILGGRNALVDGNRMVFAPNTQQATGRFQIMAG